MSVEKGKLIRLFSFIHRPVPAFSRASSSPRPPPYLKEANPHSPNQPLTAQQKSYLTEKEKHDPKIN
jgi:hypothetical protein